jgi:hypothetical protein
LITASTGIPVGFLIGCGPRRRPDNIAISPTSLRPRLPPVCIHADRVSPQDSEVAAPRPLGPRGRSRHGFGSPRFQERLVTRLSTFGLEHRRASRSRIRTIPFRCDAAEEIVSRTVRDNRLSNARTLWPSCVRSTPRGSVCSKALGESPGIRWMFMLPLLRWQRRHHDGLEIFEPAVISPQFGSRGLSRS